MKVFLHPSIFCTLYLVDEMFFLIYLSFRSIKSFEGSLFPHSSPPLPPPGDLNLANLVEVICNVYILL